MRVGPVSLHGRWVRLEPLSAAHAGDLARHASPDLFRYMALDVPASQTPEGLVEYIERLRGYADVVPFAITLAGSGEAVGATTYMDIRKEHWGLEIGRTWLSREHQGTAVNPECKLLLLTHAFEALGCVRVQLKTDLRNVQSQRGIEKLGAVREGVLRKHMVMPDSYVRDTVMYSITDSEWPVVKRRLQDRLAEFSPPAKQERGL